MENIYQFKVKQTNGQIKSLNDYAGKILLIVNTASKCGFTPQYGELQELYDMYKDKGFLVLAFPSNQFGGQEPLEAVALNEFCQLNYGVNFPVFEKVDVVGSEADDLFRFLTDKTKNGKVNTQPKWNFYKYLINRNGEVVDYFVSLTKPNSAKVKRAIEKLL